MKKKKAYWNQCVCVPDQVEVNICKTYVYIYSIYNYIYIDLSMKIGLQELPNNAALSNSSSY